MPNSQKQYKVKIRAMITKDIIVEAENEEAADEIAHGCFTVENDGPEDYEQDTIGEIVEVH